LMPDLSTKSNGDQWTICFPCNCSIFMHLMIIVVSFSVVCNT
jgi:hypothetical protein